VCVISQSCHMLCTFYSASCFSQLYRFTVVPVCLDQHLPPCLSYHGLTTYLEIHLYNLPVCVSLIVCLDINQSTLKM
jgi:hypothetical protein